MYGEPALPPDFVSLPYANPDAPKGGRIIFGESGGFDSLNPFILKGNAPAGVSALTVETLLGRSYDEPFTLYGLLAESVETDAARSFVAFTLREEARFADGSPVTPEDVLWSFETLGTQGSPRYAAAWAKIAKAEKTGPRTVRFTFNTEDRELPLILGLRPILKKAQWDGKDFTVSSLEAIIGSGPYVIGPFEPGRFISYLRNPDWWGADLPFNRGLHNFDEVRYEYFGDGGVVFEAFKAGDITSYREANPAAWAGNYGFPAVQSGQVVLSEIPHQRPSGIEGFVFNTRREIFADWRVREALIQAFNFEFINRTLTGGVQPRITSYFSNSVLGMTPGAPAQGRERALLAPFADSLLPGALDGYALPVSDGSEANRTGIREATRLLQEAGWTVTDGVLTNAAGTPFAFDILLVQGQDDMLSIANIYVEALRRLGIAVTVTTVDSAQYKERTNRYDFDMTHYIRSLSLSPGNEQMLYWGAAGVTEPGTRNWMGMNSPAAEAMIRALLTATDPQEFIAASRALDRVLTSGRYVVPIWYSDVSRIAHARQLQYPDRLPIYGDWLGFQPDVWWYQD
ncbi:MAG: ABC transporter substrate-binding protein [Rhodobacter sp.]|nr:ABC transporter substrate-binding protein [Rhodobacter sp.]MCA3458056.1 ABC transporter substrate-binding protein [Rhodobacter sp.]MCA3462385.1 ABC transporter substrate-binding protein [Rhodobacter sp.]MCA3463848.1 ABC transporter substrate-binding protein [Rhodobacter sp.]MCA3466841.1 ABC transporter substrate-binding protein [Rhodobacter sp.]